MPTRNIVLTDRQAKLVGRLVASGRYQNASEVLRDGLRLVEARQAEELAKLAALRAAARIGDDDFERGRFTNFNGHADLARYVMELTREALGSGRPSRGKT